MDKKALIKALRDTVQSASNTVASGVSAPVDLIAAGLRKVGMPIPQAPVGGSQWMENMGLTVPVEDGIPKLAGETLGMIVPMAATAKAPQIAAAANRGLENLAAPQTLNTPGFRGQRGAIVWHGSPHKFDAFDASKIGTGEGAQAYGHGIYTAETPSFAKLFAEKVKDMGTIKQINSEMAKLAKIMDEDSIAGQYRNFKTSAGKEAQKRYDELMNIRSNISNAPGYLYKVDLPDEAIARMLDWDKPLSQQAQNVQQSLSNFPEIKKGSAIHQQLTRDLAVGEKPIFRFSKEGQKEAAEYLKQAGIPGIKYLDEATGTSNFVVFPGEERLLRILERNGQPMGLMGAPKQTGAQATQTQRSAFVYPQQEALDIAQRNAAKPVSEGGLGLPPNNTPMDRAKAMGYPMDLYTSRHSTIGYVNKLPKPNTPIKNAEKIKAELEQLGIPVRGEQSGTGSTYLSFPGNPYKIDPAYGGGTSVPIEQMRFSTHSKRADKIPINQPDDQFVADVFPKYGNSLNEARSAIQSMIEKGGIRSRFAAFDPARINESDLLGYADPRLLGLLGLGTAGGIGAYNYMQGK